MLLSILNDAFGLTTYAFLGFGEKDNSVLAVLKQPFTPSDNPVDLEDAKKPLAFNGVTNAKRNDNFNKDSAGIDRHGD